MSESHDFPVSRRATSPIALEMFSMVCSGSVTDLACVLAAVDDERARRDTPRARLSSGRQHVALDALCAYQSEHNGMLPSRKKYDAWYAEAAGRHGSLVRSGVIRTAFGSWAAAIEVAGGQPTPAALAYQRTARGPRATKRDAIALLRACAEDLSTERLTFFGHYRPWALIEARRDPARFRVVIISLPTFHGLFERSWAKAIAAAGLPAHGGRDASALPGSRGGRVRGPSDAYSDANLVQAVVAAAAVSEHRLTCASYSAWRADQLAQAEAASTVRFIPSARVLLLRFGAWRDVLDDAGLLSDEERRRWVRRGGPRYTTSDALAALREAISALGKSDLSVADYTRWRQQQLRQRPQRRLPSAGTLDRLFGGFAAARRQATSEDDGSGARR